MISDDNQNSIDMLYIFLHLIPSQLKYSISMDTIRYAINNDEDEKYLHGYSLAKGKRIMEVNLANSKRRRYRR